MTSVAKLRAARATGATALAEYLRLHPKYQDRAFLFVEGKDDCCFYGSPVERRRSYVNIPCGNKDGVLDALSRITANRPHAQHCLFVVDKDLWDLLGITHPADPRLFITHHYSFENYLIRASLLERIWTDIIGLPLGHPHWPGWEAQFHTQSLKFTKYMLPLMAWVLDVRERRIKCNLNDIRLSTMLAMSSSGEIRRQPTFTLAEWERMGINDPTYVRDIAGLKQKHQILSAHSAKIWLRGKWELWFFQEFIRAMVAAVRAGVGGHVVSCEVNAGNIVQLLAPRTCAIPELEAYLDTNLGPRV